MFKTDREANPGVIISSPPSHILIQLLGGFFIALVGTIASIEPLGIVRGNSSKKEKPGYVAPPPQYKTREFDVFNHRVIG